ncbi:MAG: YggS family pyridoxal phosphate-dependent enzyme [Oscillospiraceae bacterium]|jgi:pyridoxal phosphate enzyme (YggS family)|nr:YggS family pyridoxal phosphate-dependent enzyme [Oscillospiraceae bacterium]
MERSTTSVAENVKRITHEIAEAAISAGRDPLAIELMAVTKTRTAGEVNEAIEAGVSLLGENRAQELTARYKDYRGEAKIHFIGHMQTNKVKSVADKVAMIESVDSPRLAKAISDECEKLGIIMDILVEINIGEETSKSGVMPDEAERLIRQIALFPAIRVKGLMAIPPVLNKALENERFFARMRQIQVDIEEKKIDNVRVGILSMGMSEDFKVAIRHGSSRVRIGTALFGNRSYG